MGIVIIKNRQDAQDYLINQFAPTDSDNRVSNALIGAGLGILGGSLVGTAVKPNYVSAGLGAALGAGLGGYLAYKKMPIPSAERNRNVGIAGIKGTGVVYVVGSHKGGQPFVETVADIRQAEELAKQLGKTGAKAFVVTPQELAMNPEYAHLYRSPAQALTNRFDDKNIFVAKYLRDNPLANRAEAEAAYKKRASNFKKAGAGLGAVAGALGGGYLGRKDGQKTGKMKALHLMRNMKKGTVNIS